MRIVRWLLTAWRTFSLAVRERPIRLLSLVVLLSSLLLVHGVVAFLLVLVLRGPEGWRVFVSPFLEIAGWGFVLVLLSLRLWGVPVEALAIRFARLFGRTVKERPAKLLAGVLLVVGIPYTFYLGLLFLFSLFAYGLSWDACSHIWGLLCLLAIPGVAAVVLGFYLWGEGRRPWFFSSSGL